MTIGAAIVDREDEPGEVEDALGFTLDGGVELARTVARPSIEIGGTFSNHEVETATGRTDVDLARVSRGCRIALERDDAIVVPFARAGSFYRFDLENDTAVDVPDLDGRGHYFGGGLDFAVGSNVWIGPFFVQYEGDEDDVRERFYGLEARFRF